MSNIWLELSDNMDATCFSSHMEFEIGCGEVTISSPPDGPRSAEPGVALLLWRWPLEEANKGKTANEARRNETETRHEANKGNDKQATKHDDTKQNGTRQDETKAAAPTAEPQGEGGGGRERERGRQEGGGTSRCRKAVAQGGRHVPTRSHS